MKDEVNLPINQAASHRMYKRMSEAATGYSTRMDGWPTVQDIPLSRPPMVLAMT